VNTLLKNKFKWSDKSDRFKDFSKGHLLEGLETTPKHV